MYPEEVSSVARFVFLPNVIKVQSKFMRIHKYKKKAYDYKGNTQVQQSFNTEKPANIWTESVSMHNKSYKKS
jgi:hypothetical protein